MLSSTAPRSLLLDKCELLANRPPKIGPGIAATHATVLAKDFPSIGHAAFEIARRTRSRCGISYGVSVVRAQREYTFTRHDGEEYCRHALANNGGELGLNAERSSDVDKDC